MAITSIAWKTGTYLTEASGTVEPSRLAHLAQEPFLDEGSVWLQDAKACPAHPGLVRLGGDRDRKGGRRDEH
jgi:hypothetical protein